MRLTSECSAECGAKNQRSTAVINPTVQAELVEITKYFNTFESWARQVKNVAAIADQDGAHDPNRTYETNYLRFLDQLDGTIRVDGQLSEEYAQIVIQAISRGSQSLFNSYAADCQVDSDLAMPSQATLQAFALVDIVRRSNGAPNAPFKPLADITLVVEANNPHGATEVGAITSDMLLCDPVFHPIVIDSLGTPIDAGRTTRLATSTQRRALAVRDGGCVFPGCTATPDHCEAHHVIHFRNGGKTDLNNLALLCHHHHAVTHRNSWHMESVDPGGLFKWTTPTGKTVFSQRHGRRTTEPPSPTDQRAS